MDAPAEKLYIFTLGVFRVEKSGHSLMQPSETMSKMWNVFKYLISHRDRALPAEVICEVFWPDAPWPKARQALYNMIHRLRSVLGSQSSSDALFVLRDGVCRFNPEANYWLDADEFRLLTARAQEIRSDFPEQARRFYKEALEYYHGSFLVENFYDDWVKPAQAYYQRLFETAVAEYADLLSENGQLREARSVCLRALEEDELNEGLQARVMRSYIAEGELPKARRHYEAYTTTAYREHGILPSKELRSLYRQTQNHSGNDAAADLETIQEILEQDPENEGFALCNPEFFRYVYKLEQHRMLRMGTKAFLVKISLLNAKRGFPEGRQLSEAVSALETALRQTLRSSDIICHWTDAQYLLILPAVEQPGLKQVLHRVQRAYKSYYRGDVQLAFRQRPVVPDITQQKAN